MWFDCLLWGAEALYKLQVRFKFRVSDAFYI